MKENVGYIKYTKFLVVVVFLVIAAGGIVRTTQSGMGCPDWPKCFGMWVPPTNANQLPLDFEKYLKQQDIDHSFNVYHTWIEYINRLLGALLGFFILIYVYLSFKFYYKTNKKICYYSLVLLLLVGFQGWLGKKVVDTNLQEYKITIHMLVALVIAAIPIYVLHLAKPINKIYNQKLKLITNAALCIITIQIVLGTNVRQQIDVIAKQFLYQFRELWISKLNIWFIVHRSFSWIVALSILYIFVASKPFVLLAKQAKLLLGLTISLLFLGVMFTWCNMPSLAQPLHLLASSVLAIALFNYRLQLK
jgi:heme a synthase